MYRKQAMAQSPLRILEASIHGGLGKGNLGVVTARAGVGKTACLVQIGLDNQMRDRKVLHISLSGQSVDHVQSWYDALFDDIARHSERETRESAKKRIAANRLIQVQTDRNLSPEHLERTVALFAGHLAFEPAAILIDDFDWTGPIARTAVTLSAFKATAEKHGAELWMTAQTHREETGPRLSQVPPPVNAYVDLIDVVLGLEPERSHVLMRLLKDHDYTELKDAPLRLQCDTMRLVTSADELGPARLPASACRLMSGAAEGAEAEFGACAERWGCQESNFTFEGRPVVRRRGLVVLDEGELERGDVSASYLRARMHRTYPATALFRKVLQTIWHQVNTAGQVFVVGVILPNGTVKGGTGWAAELAKHHQKPVFVYDQERRGWLTWQAGGWVDAEAPVISSRRFTGTGSRDLAEHGKAAIRDLFERSFGKAR